MTLRLVKAIPPNVLREMTERLRASSVMIECLHPGLSGLCWVRTSAAMNGYLGSYTTVTAGGCTVKGHYASFQALHGLLRDPGLVLDHLCWTPACWNPGHVEPVTPAVNNGRHAPYDDGRYREVGGRTILWDAPVLTRAVS